jgi:hypothetical protein
MKLLRWIFSRISALLILIYKVTKRIFMDILKWYDLWIFLLVIYGMIEVNGRFFEKPTAGQNLLQSFIEWYAVFYSLALSVILGEAWRRHNKINFEIDREADALKLLLQAGKMFPDKRLFGSLLVKVYAYAKCVLELQLQDDRSKTPSYQLMQSIRDCVDKMIQNGSNAQECLKSELLRQYCEAYDARGDRFDLIRQTMPTHIWFVLGAFSLAWLWGFLWLEFPKESLNLKRYILSCTTLSIGYLFYAARALNDPSKGSWKLTFIPFRGNLFETEF